MYTAKMNNKAESYYNVTLSSNDNSHYLNIYISQVDETISVSISKSEDGFYFKSPCAEANDLELNPNNNLDETYKNIKKHYLEKGYRLASL